MSSMQTGTKEGEFGAGTSFLLGDKGLEPLNQKSKVSTEEEKDAVVSIQKKEEQKKNESLKEKLTLNTSNKSRNITRA